MRVRIVYKDENGNEHVKYTSNPLVVIPLVSMGAIMAIGAAIFAILAIPFALVAGLVAMAIGKK